MKQTCIQVIQWVLFVFCLSWLSNPIYAQCDSVLAFTEKSMSEINDVYQFTFLHTIPQNKLDTLINQFYSPNTIIDSSYYNWSNNLPVSKIPIDRFQFEKAVDAIGVLKTKEAFLVLNLPFMLPFRMKDDLSPFDTFTSNLAYFGALKVINKYYLRNAVSSKLSKEAFANEVIVRIIPLRNKYFKDLKYCR